MLPPPQTLTDWRGRKLELGTKVTYPVRHGSSMWLVEGEIASLPNVNLQGEMKGPLLIRRLREMYSYYRAPNEVPPRTVDVESRLVTVVD